MLYSTYSYLLDALLKMERSGCKTIPDFPVLLRLYLIGLACGRVFGCAGGAGNFERCLRQFENGSAESSLCAVCAGSLKELGRLMMRCLSPGWDAQAVMLDNGTEQEIPRIIFH